MFTRGVVVPYSFVSYFQTSSDMSKFVSCILFFGGE